MGCRHAMLVISRILVHCAMWTKLFIECLSFFFMPWTMQHIITYVFKRIWLCDKHAKLCIICNLVTLSFTNKRGGVRGRLSSGFLVQKKLFIIHHVSFRKMTSSQSWMCCSRGPTLFRRLFTVYCIYEVLTGTYCHRLHLNCRALKHSWSREIQAITLPSLPYPFFRTKF